MTVECRAGVAPPMCCQPTTLTDAEWQEATRRLRAAGEAVRARFPQACPACGAPEPFPTFLAPDEYECSDAGCAAVWTVQP